MTVKINLIRLCGVNVMQDKLSDNQLQTIRNSLINKAAFPSIFSSFESRFHEEIKSILIAGTSIDIVRFLYEKGFTALRDIHNTFSVRTLNKKLRVLTRKGYILQKSEAFGYSYKCSPAITILESVPKNNKNNKKIESPCYSCGNISEMFDALSSNRYCDLCYVQLLKYSKKHNSFSHVKKRLQQRYSIKLTVNLYNEMMSQIMDKSIPTFIPKNKKVFDYTSIVSRTRHLVIIEEKQVIAEYKNSAGLDENYISTVIPKEIAFTPETLSFTMILDVVKNKQIKQKLIKYKGELVSLGKADHQNKVSNIYDETSLEYKYWLIGYNEDKLKQNTI